MYQILDQHTLPNFISCTEELRELFGNETPSIQEIGDGNLNFVYIAQNSKVKVIFKQSVPYLRCAGDSWPLGKERMTFEIRASKIFEELAHGFTPEIYYTNEDMCLIAMRYLDDCIIMRKGLIAGHSYPKFAEHITDFLSKTLFYTSSYYLQSAEKRQLIDKFNANRELCKLSEDFIFTFPYINHHSNKIDENIAWLQLSLQQDAKFKVGLLKLKYLFMNQTDALLHGDLHTGSIMINAKHTYVIDPEFAFVGPFGFDIGAVIANLIQSYVSHFARSKDRDYQRWLLGVVKDVFTLFEIKFLALWNGVQDSAMITDDFAHGSVLGEYQEFVMKKIFRESVGFAGAKIARRLFGIAGAEDLDGISDTNEKAEAKKRALSIAKRFVCEYGTLEGADDVVNIIATECLT